MSLPIQLVEEITLGSFVAAERQRERNRREMHDRQQPSGVRWSGMGGEAFPARTGAEIEADAHKVAAQVVSPKGRLLSAINELNDTGCEAEGCPLLDIYFRHLTSPYGVDAIVDSLVLLETVQTSTGRQAREALYEMLRSFQQEAA